MLLKTIVFLFVSWFVLISCAFSTQQRGPANDETSELTTAAAGTTPESAPAGRCEGRQIDTCISIDRNPAVQTMKVYHNGRLVNTFPVSTGRETYDIPNNFDRSPGCSFTPLGSFTISALFENYLSNTWRTDRNNDGRYTADEQAEMPHAMRLRNSSGHDTGIFIHAATSDKTINALGPKSTMAGFGSGGCIRLDPRDARSLFDDLAGCTNPNGPSYLSCQNREINTPAGRKLTCNRGSTTLPLACCESATKRNSCLQYAGGYPVCNDDSPECLAKQQTPISPRQRQMVVEISDSRSAEQIRHAEDSCAKDRTNYENLFANCVANKLGSASVTAFNALTETDKLRYRTICNEEIYRQSYPATSTTGTATTAAGAPASDGREAPPATLPTTPTRTGGFFRAVGNWFRGLKGR